MNDEELGLDTFIERKDGKEFISIPSDKEGKSRRFEIGKTPIAVHRAAVCRGTSCFPTEDGKTVVEFFWPSAKRWRLEPTLLRQASQRNVQGVVKLVGYKELSNTSDLRSGLIFHERKRLEGRDRKIERTASSSGSQLASVSLVNGSFSTQKRELDDEQSPPSKKTKIQQPHFKIESEPPVE